MSSFAVMADVHGNSWALEAVLADIRRRGIDSIINLGDCCNGPLDPRGAAAALRQSSAVHIRGNGDRMTGEGGADLTKSVKFARELLDSDTLDWLRNLPATRRGTDWIAFHGSPTHDNECLLEDIREEGVSLKSESAIASSLSGITEPVCLCGHSHVPRLVRLRDGRIVVNPGSVGLPAYKDEWPFPHRMETGSPHARYAIVEQISGQWAVEFLAIAYDWNAAAARAELLGFSDWAKALKTGYV